MSPLAVDRAGSVGTLVGVRAEGIALRLREALGQPGGPVRVEVAERSRVRQHGNPRLGCGRDGAAPACLGIIEALRERWIQEQVDELWLLAECMAHRIEQPSANNAPP